MNVKLLNEYRIIDKICNSWINIALLNKQNFGLNIKLLSEIRVTKQT